jgi:uncharacterized C2H2 Zn-finger protein
MDKFVIRSPKVRKVETSNNLKISQNTLNQKNLIEVKNEPEANYLGLSNSIPKPVMIKKEENEDNKNYEESDDDCIIIEDKNAEKNSSQSSKIDKKIFKEFKKSENQEKFCKKLLKCSRCKFSTKIHQEYKRHENKHKSSDKKLANGENWQQCKKCPSVLKTRTTLKSHYKLIHTKKFYECDVCGQKFKIKTNIQKHLFNIHFKEFEHISERRSKWFQTRIMLGNVAKGRKNKRTKS